MRRRTLIPAVLTFATVALGTAAPAAPAAFPACAHDFTVSGTNGTYSPAALAHDPFGRAQPSIGFSVIGSGNSQKLKVVVVDLDSRAPIQNLKVSAYARRPWKTASRELRVAKLSQIIYFVRLGSLPDHGKWRISLKAFGTNIVSTAISGDVERGA